MFKLLVILLSYMLIVKLYARNNIFKASVAIILKILRLLSVVLRFLDDKIILMLSYLTFRSSPPWMFSEIF